MAIPVRTVTHNWWLPWGTSGAERGASRGLARSLLARGLTGRVRFEQSTSPAARDHPGLEHRRESLAIVGRQPLRQSGRQLLQARQRCTARRAVAIFGLRCSQPAISSVHHPSGLGRGRRPAHTVITIGTTHLIHLLPRCRRRWSSDSRANSTRAPQAERGVNGRSLTPTTKRSKGLHEWSRRNEALVIARVVGSVCDLDAVGHARWSAGSDGGQG